MVGMESIRVGETYCVAAHPYLRWTVVGVAAEAGAVANVTLRSTADPAVERVVAAPVLQNPARFTRLAAA
jgi:hypothetical protein